MPAVTGVDQDLAATCKVRNSLSAWACLYIACRYEHSTPWQGTIFSSEHPWIVYIRCNGFTEGFAPHLICFIFSCLNQLEAVGSTLVTENHIVAVRLNSAADFGSTHFRTLTSHHPIFFTLRNDFQWILLYLYHSPLNPVIFVTLLFFNNLSCDPFLTSPGGHSHQVKRLWVRRHPQATI